MSSFVINQFKSKNMVNAGAKAKSMGDLFERMMKLSCAAERIHCERIPDGCKVFKTRSGVVLPKKVNTPFDFVIAKNGKSANIDTKTIESGNFSYSMIKMHQVVSLLNFYDNKIPSGYLVWFRDVNQMIFFDAKKLYHLKRRESLKPSDGINLGSSSKFSLNPVLNLFAEVL